MTNFPTVAVLVLCTNELRFLEDCFTSLAAQNYPALRLYLLDNGSTDGSVEYVRAQFPQTKILLFGRNLGYAAANNRGMETAFADGADFCLVLNSDVRCAPDMISELVATHLSAASSGVRAGLAQPCILLFSQPDKINTLGNALHYLGFGYCGGYLRTFEQPVSDTEISSVSGACMLVPRDYYADVGGFDEDFFIYNEDQNYSWRGLLLGYEHRLSAKAILYHKYNFHRSSFKMYHSEKNRWMILLSNYQLRTVFLILPALLMCELMLIVHGLANGWLLRKIKADFYVLTHLPAILRKRSRVQQARKVDDRALWRRLDPALDFAVFENPLMRLLVNPLFGAYYRLIRLFI